MEMTMNIIKARTGSTLKIALQGRLNTAAAYKLDNEIRPILDSVTILIWDLGELEYISATGLRLLLAAQKVMNTQGKMVVINANELITEIFEVTGFTSILTLE
jgi:anti-sigma B factor antagonist